MTEHVPERWILNLLLVLCQCILIVSSHSGGNRASLGVRQFPEPVFVNVYGAQELIPMDRFRQPMYIGGPVRQIGLSYRLAIAGNRFLGSLKGLQIRALSVIFTLAKRIKDTYRTSRRCTVKRTQLLIRRKIRLIEGNSKCRYLKN